MALNDTQSTIAKKLLLLMACSCLLLQAGAQATNDYLLWNADRKLTVDDFAIKTKQLASTPSMGHFLIDYEVSGFSFFNKNFNKKVRNYFLRSASWIDTATNGAQSLRYQQTLFDLAEIYARQFRKALRENRKQFVKGTTIAETLNKAHMAAFAKRRVDYDSETVFGTDSQKQAVWEEQVKNELHDLREFAYDK